MTTNLLSILTNPLSFTNATKDSFYSPHPREAQKEKTERTKQPKQASPIQRNERQKDNHFKVNGKRTKGQSTSTKRSDSNEPLLNIIRAYAHGLPSGTQHAEVGFVTPLSVFLSGGEELVGLFRELFCYRSET